MKESNNRQEEAVWLPIEKECDTMESQMDEDKQRYKRAIRFIHLLRLENAQLHAVVRVLGQLVDDMNNNCSYEVFEAEWKDVTDAIGRLASFFSRHQKNMQQLHDECPREDEYEK
jgi:Mg2+ and Co2+ transporter CorA